MARYAGHETWFNTAESDRLPSPVWIKPFICIHNVHRPAKIAEPEINAFLTHMAVRQLG